MEIQQQLFYPVCVPPNPNPPPNFSTTTTTNSNPKRKKFNTFILEEIILS